MTAKEIMLCNAGGLALSLALLPPMSAWDFAFDMIVSFGIAGVASGLIIMSR